MAAAIQRARIDSWNEFARLYGVNGKTRIEAVIANPFNFEGKNVAIYTSFQRMLSRDTAIFGSVMGPSFVVSGVLPNFSNGLPVILVVKVMGMKDQVADLRYSGVYFCTDLACSTVLDQHGNPPVE